MDDEQSILTEDVTLNNQIEDEFDPNLVIDDAPNPYEQAERRDTLKRLMFICNSQLTDEQKKIIGYKCGFKDKPMTFREIAKKLKTNIDLVTHRYQDAIATIKFNWDLNPADMKQEHGKWYYKAKEQRRKNYERWVQKQNAYAQFRSTIIKASDYDLALILYNWQVFKPVANVVLNHAKQKLTDHERLTRIYGSVYHGNVDIDKKLVDRCTSQGLTYESNIFLKYIEEKYGKECYTCIGARLREIIFEIFNNAKDRIINLNQRRKK